MKKIKHIPKCLIFGILIYLTVNTVQAQYITLQGRQFKSSNGQNFYPMVCNYGFEPVYNPGSTNYYLSRVNGYGPGSPASWNGMPNYEFEDTTQATAYAEILADFTKIHNMGFNCIRTAGYAPSKCDTDSVGIVGFYMTCFRNKIPIDDTTGEDTRKVSINLPYSSDSFLLNYYFPGIDLILQAARSCSLKVILDCVYGDIAIDPNGIDAADYAGYLSVLANRYKNDTTLLAYVSIEEPEWSRQGGLNKQLVCNYSAQWYDAITNADTNHLVTVGGCGYWGAPYWDMSVIKMDFYSAHIYPYTLAYESYSPNTAFERWKGAVIWMHNNCPTPWIIGETGFSAYDDWYNDSTWLPHYAAPPLTNGNLTQQATFAQKSLSLVRSCGGSGYSWWNFQENWWGIPMEDGYGLFRHGDINDPATKKPVADVFDTIPSPQSWSYPNYYYDPYNWDSLCPPPCLGWYHRVHGTITETGTTNPIDEAFIGAWTWYRLSSDSIGQLPHPSSTFTFSDHYGSYSLNPWYPNSNNSGYLYIGVTAAGANLIWPNSSIPQPPLWECDTVLQYSPFKYDLVIYNETVIAGDPRNFQGWGTLTVNNSVIVDSSAVSEFKARDGVTINGDFTAELGSDVYIYCTATFPECKDYTGFKIMNVNNTIPDETQGSEENYEKQMEVNFIPISEYAFLDVYPNPGNGIFTLNLRTNKENNTLMQVQIYDITGSCVFKEIINENISNLDLSILSRGIYYIHATTKDDSFNQKLIIK